MKYIWNISLWERYCVQFSSKEFYVCINKNSRSRNSSRIPEINSCKSITHIFCTVLQKCFSSRSINSHRFRIAYSSRQSGARLLWINRAIFYDDLEHPSREGEAGRRIHSKSSNPLIYWLNGAGRGCGILIAFLVYRRIRQPCDGYDLLLRAGKCHQVIQNR